MAQAIQGVQAAGLQGTETLKDVGKGEENVIQGFVEANPLVAGGKALWSFPLIKWGIILGGGLFLLGIIALISFLVYRHYSKKKHAEKPSNPNHHDTSTATNRNG